MNNPILSLCIASYNKADLTEALVKSMLTIESKEYDIVVVDNCSTDDTVDRIKAINSPLVSVVVNEKNIGGAANTVKAPYCGDGLYSLYINDRDLIIPEKIPSFISFLKKNTHLTAGHCTRTKDTNKPLYTILETKEALCQYAIMTSHPTGFFFSKKTLAGIPLESITDLMNKMDFVPLLHEYTFAECICKGPVANYNDVLWKSTGDSTHKKYVSGYVDVNVDLTKKWFHPQNCINRAKFNISYIQKLDKKYNLQLNSEDYMTLYKTIIKAEHSLGVWRYRAIMTTPSLAYHYSVPVSKISVLQSLKQSRAFQTKFFDMLQSVSSVSIDYGQLKEICYTDNRNMIMNKIKIPLVRAASRIYHIIIKKK